MKYFARWGSDLHVGLSDLLQFEYNCALFLCKLNKMLCIILMFNYTCAYSITCEVDK